MYLNFSELWSFSFKASTMSHLEVAYGLINYYSASTEALQNTIRLFVNRFILVWKLWRKSLVLCGKLLFTSVSDTVLMVYDHNCVFCCFWLNHYLSIESKALLSVTVFDCGIYFWLLQSQI